MSWKVRHFLKTVRAQHEYEREQNEVTSTIAATSAVTTITTASPVSTTTTSTNSNTQSSTKRVTIKTTPEIEKNPGKNNQPSQSATDITTQAVSSASSLNSPTVAAISAIAALGSTNPTLHRSSPCPSNSGTGRYVNWCTKHTELASHPWCCIGDLIAFCDKYEFKTLSLADTRTHNTIVAEVKSLLTVGQAPFDLRRRFPGNIQNPENLWVCIGRCASVEYHLKKILSVFRKPLALLSADKQRAARQNFHLAVNELRLDISARISEVRLYDRSIFERDFHLRWQDTAE